ncbi:MAG TPA: PQQ-dependent sugar dehydrogenase [Burkholderiales bacterium]|nr:PQQ-dependent sugar dehydrogenase [Burkholderiales bacterium]
MFTFTGFLAAGLAAVLAAAPALAQRTVESAKHRVQVQTVAKGLEHPWGLALLPDGRFLVTERNSGRLRIGTPQGELSPPVENVPEVFRYEGPTDRSQGGLFHVALHPRFAENRLVYLSLSQPSEEGAGTAVVRGRLVEEGGAARLENVETVYTMNRHDSSGLHWGGRFVFHPRDGTLFITVGERRNISRAQDAEDHAGSVIRVTDDGQVPKDNPFVKDDEKDDKIFSYGHRNPQGIAVHPQTQEVWLNDHGPKAGDEINRLRPGANYGWPFQTGGVDYSGAPLGKGRRVEGMEPPVHIFEKTAAPSGLVFYAGAQFPAWKGDLVHGALQGEGIIRTRVEGDKVVEEEWIELGRRIRDVQVAPDGALWLVTEHEDGEVLRLTAAK